MYSKFCLNQDLCSWHLRQLHEVEISKFVALESCNVKKLVKIFKNVQVSGFNYCMIQFPKALLQHCKREENNFWHM
jgi:rhamnogalacturonyl hydrolase YesR